MRRSDREITSLSEIEQILKKGRILHLALNNGVYPYLLTVNYGYHLRDGALELFFHGAAEGEKHAVIARDAHASFELECETEFLPPVGEVTCTAAFAYESIIGQGVIEPVPDSEKVACLTDLMRHFGVETVHFAPEHLANTKLYRLKAEAFTAKRRPNR